MHCRSGLSRRLNEGVQYQGRNVFEVALMSYLRKEQEQGSAFQIQKGWSVTIEQV